VLIWGRLGLACPRSRIIPTSFCQLGFPLALFCHTFDHDTFPWQMCNSALLEKMDTDSRTVISGWKRLAPAHGKIMADMVVAI
jgi:hypothetical protein